MTSTDFQKVFHQAMDLWFLPEIERRQSAGKIDKPYKLRAAQVIFHADVRQKRKIVAGIAQAMVDGAGTEAKEVHVEW